MPYKPDTSHLDAITPFRVMELLGESKRLEAAGRDVIHMEVGEPGFPVVEPVLAEALRALKEEDIGYTTATGLPPLKQAIADSYLEKQGVDIDPQRILITTGASGALLLLSNLLFRPDQDILVTDPGYPCNNNFVRLAGAQPLPVQLTAERNFQLTVDDLQQCWTDKTKGLLVASPSNPTGVVLSKENLQGISQFVEQKQGFLLVDEIYHGLTYGKNAVSILEIDTNAFVVNSFSKYFGMTGWRLGWMVVPPDCVSAVEKLAQNLFIAPPTLSQYAALALFNSETREILDQRRDTFEKRRDFLLSALRNTGFDVPYTPDGAFYIYAGIDRFIEKGLANNSEDFCRQLLQQQYVAVTPGTDFGKFKAEHYVRFAYTCDMPVLEEAVSRMVQFTQGGNARGANEV